MKVLVTLSYIIWSSLGHRLFFLGQEWAVANEQQICHRNPLNEKIVWDFNNYWNLCYSYMEKKKRPHQKYAMTQLVNVYIPMNKPAKAYHCPKLWFTFSRCNSSCQGFLLPSTQNIMLLMPICLFLPHLWDPANLRVLWSSTCDQKATKLAQRTERVL